ncbi:hypothetical protein ACFIJ5_17185 [Haloimpatiens sp. FM7330]|uniref:hypothetical protein n=1 Tax=Haloimpatiens sp. FM7330 TaxID=3298610 RepID=UPI0036275BE1
MVKKKNGNNGINVSQYDKVFTSKTLGGSGKKSNITGDKKNNGSMEQIKTQKGVTLRGNSVPYNKVVGEYKNRAMENVKRSDIPDGMKEIVKSYFSSLEE